MYPLAILGHISGISMTSVTFYQPVSANMGEEMSRDIRLDYTSKEKIAASDAKLRSIVTGRPRIDTITIGYIRYTDTINLTLVAEAIGAARDLATFYWEASREITEMVLSVLESQQQNLNYTTPCRSLIMQATRKMIL